MFKKDKDQKSKSKKFALRQVLTALFFVFVFSVCSPIANAQCAMCRAAIESEGDKSKGEAVNDGIVYLMLIPYLLIGGIGYAVYKMQTKKKKS